MDAGASGEFFKDKGYETAAKFKDDSLWISWKNKYFKINFFFLFEEDYLLSFMDTFFCVVLQILFSAMNVCMSRVVDAHMYGERGKCDK